MNFIMKINHVAIYTNQLEAMKDFYEIYFNGQANQRYHNLTTGLMTYFISFEGDTRLELMARPDLTAMPLIPGVLTGYAHLAFSVGSKDAVDQLTAALSSQGFRTVSAPRTTGDGYYESCIEDPDGNLVEIAE